MNLTENKVFCDTSFFIASLCPEDSNFEKAGELLKYCMDNSVTLCTTWDVISETATLLRYRGDQKAAVLYLEKIKPFLFIVQCNESVKTAAEEVFMEFPKNKRLSFCDAISYIVVTHMLDNMPCLSFDKDFRGLGLTVYPKMEL